MTQRLLCSQALDELEATIFARRRPYGGRVATVMDMYTTQWGKPSWLTRLVTLEPGTEAQDRRLDRWYNRHAEELVDDGSDKALAEHAIVALVIESSARQRQRLADAYRHMPWSIKLYHRLPPQEYRRK